MKEKRIYRAVIYARLSKEDRDRTISGSILNQIDICWDFIQKCEDLTFVRSFEDDGYTGYNFNRPGFQAMLDFIRKNKADCVVVKDQSRLGRNEDDTPIMIEKTFPELGSRYIAIMENDDSNDKSFANRLSRAVRSMANGTVVTDASEKIRMTNHSRMEKGEFTVSKTPFGYMKDPDNKRKLVIYEPEGEVVRKIFALFQQGYVISAIAKLLNDEMIMTPLEFKSARGEKNTTPFRGDGQSKWQYNMVLRILKDERYIGTMIQGRYRAPKPNMQAKPVKAEEWYRVENCMAPIICEDVFMRVQDMLQRDTRAGKDGDKKITLSPFVFCPDCGQGMTRITQGTIAKKYNYYMCSTKKRYNGCTPHRIREDRLEDIVFHSVVSQLNLFIELQKNYTCVSDEVKQSVQKNQYEELMERLQTDLENIKRREKRIYEDYKEGILTKRELNEYQAEYRRERETKSKSLEDCKKRLEVIRSGYKSDPDWIGLVKQYINAKELSCDMLFALVEKVYVHENKTIEIIFRYKDMFDEMERAVLLNEELSKAGNV